MAWPSYGVGALAAVGISLGVALIVYSLGLLPFDWIHLVAWFFGPLGAWTLAYAFVRRQELVYYAFWGIIMLAVALAVPLWLLGVPLPALAGTVILIIVVLGLAAYLSGRGG